jgi:glyoxylate/hydroxypyruvate reductase
MVCIIPRLGVNLPISVTAEHLPLSALAKRGIKLGYTPDIPNDAVADLSVMLALMAGRNGGETLTMVKEGQVKNCPVSGILLTSLSGLI